MMESPLVSVVMCVYNGEAFIREAIESVLAQTYERVELVVIDDGSSDSTPSILGEYVNRITTLSHTNMGQSRSRNRGILESKGEFICILDSDDVLPPDSVEKRMRVITNSPSMALVMCHPQYINKDGQPLETQPQPYEKTSFGFFDMVAKCPTPPSCWIFRKEAFVRAGMFDQFILYCEDWDVAIRLSLGNDVGYLPEVGAKYRIQLGSSTSNYEKMYGYAKKVLWKNYVYTDKRFKYALFAFAGLKNQFIYLYRRRTSDLSRSDSLRGNALFAVKHPESLAILGAHLAWTFMSRLKRLGRSG